MEKIDANGNIIIYNDEKQLENCKITFNSKNSICYIKDAVLKGTNITFGGNNSILFVGKTNLGKIGIIIHTQSTIFIGNSVYFNPAGFHNLMTSERNNIFIGDKCAISFNLWIRLADPHLIFDAKTKNRINPSKSVFIGDHVWIGQDIGITKGAMISSGCVVGAKSLVSGKAYLPNSIIAGIPAKTIKNDIFWSGECVHNWEIKTSQKHEKRENADDFIFNNIKFKGTNLALQTDLVLKKAKSAKERLEILQKFHENKDRSRFVFDTNSRIYSSALDVIYEHLSYKLGRAIIENSKSILDYVKLPFILLKIVKNHNSKNLPNLKLFLDYNEALKIKNYFSYKLGFAMIKAAKTWYKGGIFLLFFEIMKIKKEHKKK